MSIFFTIDAPLPSRAFRRPAADLVGADLDFCKGRGD
jgi:hypothetical protein